MTENETAIIIIPLHKLWYNHTWRTMYSFGGHTSKDDVAEPEKGNQNDHGARSTPL